MYSISDNNEIHDILMNLVNHPSFSDIFQKMNGITQILYEVTVKKTGWYISLMIESSKLFISYDFYDEVRNNVEFVAKLIIDHTFALVCSITPSYILNSMPNDNV
ncbi:hypothetical protein MXB_4410 [Myxobolus squamalis]|nr:hypothetical protein MXB_4410 [Myxobolus squamalis]